MRVVVAQYEGVTTMRPLPLAAGLLVATARASPALAHLDFDLEVSRRPVASAAERLRDAMLVGLSLYTWNERYSLAVARALRALSPRVTIVVGGPSVPRDDVALESFLTAHPALDLVVLGEGELAFRELLERHLAGEDLLVPGSARLVDGHLERAIPRDRLAGTAFARTTSPYLDGTFDTLIARGDLPLPNAVVLETNRGCPFSCSFCDWGQATESKVYELPMDRVLAELEWAATRRIPYLYFVDANFGIRRRDEDIVRHIGALRQRHQAPHFVYFHLTKNARQRNLRTVELLQDADIGSQVSLSMQDLEPAVLEAIDRDNIDPADALALREHCHQRGLPTTNELLLGLPRQTLASIRQTLAAALTPFPTDTFFLYPLRLLPNAPLARHLDRFGLVLRTVPLLARRLDEAHPEPEHERLVVGHDTLPIADWRQAFIFGHALTALHDQALLPMTLRVWVWQLSRPVATLVDGLLEHFPPLFDTLARYADAILSEEATSLPLPGFGPHRWEPIEAAVAAILNSPDAFFDALDDLCSTHGETPLDREARALDRALLARRGDPANALEVHWDWPDWGDGRVAPTASAGLLELGPVHAHDDPASHLAWFIAAGWARSPRRHCSHRADTRPRHN